MHVNYLISLSSTQGKLFLLIYRFIFICMRFIFVLFYRFLHDEAVRTNKFINDITPENCITTDIASIRNLRFIDFVLEQNTALKLKIKNLETTNFVLTLSWINEAMIQEKKEGIRYYPSTFFVLLVSLILFLNI